MVFGGLACTQVAKTTPDRSRALARYKGSLPLKAFVLVKVEGTFTPE
jgi:hypothetical protein